jgi:hypothetical protein
VLELAVNWLVFGAMFSLKLMLLLMEFPKYLASSIELLWLDLSEILTEGSWWLG